MAIDYFLESQKYRPKEIKMLLIGEAPPASGKTYFYVPKPMDTSMLVLFVFFKRPCQKLSQSRPMVTCDMKPKQ